MKLRLRKLISTGIVIAMLLSAVPMQAFAGSEGGAAYSVDCISITKTAFGERATGIIHAGAVSRPDADNISEFYLLPAQSATMHRISIWSMYEMDPSKLTLTGNNITLAGNMTRQSGSLSSHHQTTYYLYQAPVQIGTADGEVTVSYDGTALGKIKLIHQSMDACYIGEAYIPSANQDGTLNLEFSGVNIPEQAVVSTVYTYEGNPVTIWAAKSAAACDSLGVCSVKIEKTTDEQYNWQSVAINGSPAQRYGGGSVEIAEVKAFGEGGQSPSVINNPPTISFSSVITSPAITFTITANDYPTMRSRLDSGSFSGWGSTADTSFSLTAGDFGLHTAYFEFKTQSGDELKVNKTFTYSNGTVAAAPDQVFVKDEHGKKLVPSNDLYSMTEGMNYRPAAVYGTASDETAALEALVYCGDDTQSSLDELAGIQKFDMVRISGTNSYETMQSFEASSGSYRIGVRVKQGAYDLAPGSIKEIAAEGINKPQIYTAHEPLFSSRRYLSGDKYAVGRGSEISASFSGTAGTSYRGKVTLYYRDAQSDQKYSSSELGYTGSFNGWYNGVVTIPYDASALERVVYRIESVNDPDGIYEERSFDISATYQLTSTVLFTSIPASYNGALLAFGKDDASDGVTPQHTYTIGNENSVSFDGLDPGNYEYAVYGGGGEIVSGTCTVSGTAGTVYVQMPEKPLSNLSLSINGMDQVGYLLLRYRTYYGTGFKDYTEGILGYSSGSAELKYIQAYMNDGTTPTRVEIYADASYYSPVELYGTGVDQYGILSCTLAPGENSVSTAVRDYNVKTLSGTIITPLGKPAAGMTVIVDVKTETGWPLDESGSRSVLSKGYMASADKEGRYSFDGIWADKDVNVEVRNYGGDWYGSPAYCNEDFKSPADETVHNVQLRYHNYGAVTVDLGLMRIGSNEIGEGDCRLLQAPQIMLGGSLLNYNGGDNGVFYLSDSRVHPGDVIEVWYPYGEAGTIEGSGMGLYPYDNYSHQDGSYVKQQITLDAKGNGKVKFMAKELGRVSVDMTSGAALTKEQLDGMTADERAEALINASRYEGHLMVFDGRWNLLGQDEGFGKLSVEGLPDGSTKAVVFWLDTEDPYYGEYRKSMQDTAKMKGRIEAAAGDESVTVKDFNMTPCLDQVIDSKPVKAAGAMLLGGISFGIKTEILPEFPGWVQVKINVIRRDEKVRVWEVSVYNEGDISDPVNSMLYTAYTNGEKMERKYTDPDYFYARIDNTYVEAQESDTYIMFFTRVQGNQADPVANATVKVAYDYFDEWKWSAAIGTGYTNDEVAVSVSLDPFDLEVSNTAVFDTLYKDRDDFGVITAHVYGLPGDRIAIYDGDRKAAEVVLRNVREDVKIRLSDPESFGVHRLYAERINKTGPNDRSETRSVSLVNRAYTVYMNEIKWIHLNDTRLETWRFHELEDMTDTTFRYYPAKASIISFRLNNVTEGELTNVRFITTYHGTENYFRTKFAGSGVDPETGRSWCEYMIDPEHVSPGWGMKRVYFSTYTKEIAMTEVPDDLWYYSHGQNPEGKQYPMVGLGYFEDFSVDYELVTVVPEGANEEQTLQAQLESYYKATGTAVPDLNSIAEADVFTEEVSDRAKASLPSALRDGYGNGSTTSTAIMGSDSFSYSISNGENGINYSSDASDASSYDLDAVKAQMLADLSTTRTSIYTDPNDPSRVGTRTVSWVKYDTVQGEVFIKQIYTDYTVYDGNGNLADGKKVDMDISQEIYAPLSVMNAMKNGTTIEEEKAKIIADASVPKLKAAGHTGLMGALPMASGGGASRGLTAVNPDVDEGMGHLSTVGNIHGGLDIYQDLRIDKLGEESRFISKNFGRGMSALGVGLTAYDIAKGVQGKDSQALFTALNSLDMQDEKSRQARQALTNEILSYQDVRAQKYITDSVINGGLATAGVVEGVPPHVKLGLLAGGYGYNKIGEQTQGYIDSEYDSIMRSILLELERQDQRNVKIRVEVEKELYRQWENYAELMGWDDIWEDDVKVTRRQRIIREVEKELNLRFNDEKMPRFKMREEFPKLNIYVDPSGYVFEGIPDERVGGITATLYQKTGGMTYTQWEDQNNVIEDRQANPQTTTEYNETAPDNGGRYGWMTPYGTFKVAFTDPAHNYLDAQTKDMTVPPEHTMVNIGLLSTVAPEVEQVETISGGGIAVTFSKYMQMDSLVPMSAAETAKIEGNTDSYDSAASAVSLYDADGNPIPGRISFPESYDTLGNASASAVTGKYRVHNTYYKSGTYQIDEISSDWFANKVIFTPDDLASFDAEHSSVLVNKTALSYAGVPMAADYVKNVAAAEKETAPKIYTITLDVNGGDGVPAQLITGKSGRLDMVPVPVKTGFTFRGWFTSGGTKVTTDTVFGADATIYAIWDDPNSPSGGGYSGGGGGGAGTTSGAVTSGGAVTSPGAVDLASVVLPFGDVPAEEYFSDPVKWAYAAGITEGTTDTEFGPYQPCTRNQIVTMLWRAAGSPEPQSASSFSDVPEDSYFEKAAAWAKETGITTGTSEDTFSPYATCTRAQVVTFLYRFAGAKYSSDRVSPFYDVDDESFYRDSVIWALENGITTGTDSYIFSPLQSCTRAQIVTFLYRFFS